VLLFFFVEEVGRRGGTVSYFYSCEVSLKVEGGQSQAAPRLLLLTLEEEIRKKHASSSSSSALGDS
jgi:hypothetical protein